MQTEREAIERIRQGFLKLPPLDITLIENHCWQERSDTVISIVWKDATFLFSAQYKARSTPKEFAAAVDQATRKSQGSELAPLVLMPYLSERQLNDLAERQISGVDFCGNGVVIVPNQLLVFRSGKPNLFPASAAIQNIYRKDSSLVARAFLLRPAFESVSNVLSFIQMHSGSPTTVTLSTVSKVLKTLEEDLIITRENGSIHLLQPEKLLDKLVTNYRRPAIQRLFVGKHSYDHDTIIRTLAENSIHRRIGLVGTGVGSVDQYAVMAKENFISVYCTDQYRLLAGVEVKETSRFSNLEITETNDKTVYFDARPNKGFEWASPIQTYLELMAGDQRERDTADQVKQIILTELARQHS